MSKQYYAVKAGRTPGIYLNWNDCKRQVEGFSGAVFRKFENPAEAIAFLDDADGNSCAFERDTAESDAPERTAGSAVRSSSLPENGNSAREEAQSENSRVGSANDSEVVSESNVEPRVLSAEASLPHGKGAEKATAYVDGSYDSVSRDFSYGMVLFFGGEELRFSERIHDPELAEMHNVAGELKGAEAAMRYCTERGISELDLYYDYEGIAKWCLGEWQARKKGTAAYRDFYRSVRPVLKVNFIKVKGHSGDRYNDLADELAKSELRREKPI